MRKNYIHECKTIQENCTDNAETHHILAAENGRLSMWFQLAPAVVAALSGFQAAGELIPQWASPVWIWVAAASATVTAVSTVLNPLKAYFDHLNAAKGFTVLKHEARALRRTFGTDMDEASFKATVKNLHDRYNDLVRAVPPTTKKAFEEARRRIQEGVHEPDER